jgi:ribosomal protein L24E
MEGRQLRFCSKKCRIAYRMGRSRNLGWIRKQRKTDKKE